MKRILLAVGSLFALWLPGKAQHTFNVGGLYTDSGDTITLPTAPPGTTHALITYRHRSRYFYGWETMLDLVEGVAWCDWTSDGHIRQWVDVSSGGVVLGGVRTRLDFSHAGPCLPFDGVMNWAGTSGWNSGYVWRGGEVTKYVPLNQLGPTLSVWSDGDLQMTQTMTCTGFAPFQVTGYLAWLNESWWEGDVTVSFHP